LNPKELMPLEEALENGLSSIRERLVSTKIVIIYNYIYLIEGLSMAFKKRLTLSLIFVADGLLDDD
jgi:hypothetical protein